MVIGKMYVFLKLIYILKASVCLVTLRYMCINLVTTCIFAPAINLVLHSGLHCSNLKTLSQFAPK